MMKIFDHILTDQYPTIMLSYVQDTIHAEKGCAEMHDFCMAALMFCTGHGIKAGIHACTEITLFPKKCIIRTWKALSLWPCASQAQMMHLGNVQLLHGHGFLLY